MARILFLIVLIIALYFIGKRFLAFLSGDDQQDKPLSSIKDENIVQCALCGTHIPESESALVDAKTVC